MTVWGSVQQGPVRGQTWTIASGTPGASQWREGEAFGYKDRDPTLAGSTDQTQIRSGKGIVMMMVRNASGGVLLPKIAVSWQALFPNKRVDAVATDSDIAGIVDEFIPAAGVADGALFLICVRGPTLWTTIAAGATFAERGFVTAGADGKVTTAGAIDATYNANGGGRALEAAAAEADVDKLIDMRIRDNP